MRKAAPAKPEAAFHMVSGQKVPPTSLYRLRRMLSDNALCCGLPTSLLNHETSDHLLSRC